jgi:Coenzyme PQQ synthesis protein D (PqqD)
MEPITSPGTGREVDWIACPLQAPGIEINEVADGYIIYDPERDRVHYLNHTAVLVLELCTGDVRARDIPELIRGSYDLSRPPTDEVGQCLARFYEEGLVR